MRLSFPSIWFSYYTYMAFCVDPSFLSLLTVHRIPDGYTALPRKTYDIHITALYLSPFFLFGTQ